MTTPTAYDPAHPVPVEIKNWDLSAKPPVVKRTTVQTYILDPAAQDITKRWRQISDMEPLRNRLIIQVLDVAIVLTLAQPNVSPEVTTASAAPDSGRVLPPTTAFEYVFYGPDAMWINATSAVTRVTVTKEYC